MRHITKSDEPLSFVAWKAEANEEWQPIWDNLQNPEKHHLRNALVREQFSICCYCTKRISVDDAHIEHLQPRRDYSHLALTYSNLLACCVEDPAAPHERHCGAAKGHWYDPLRFISPMQIDCEKYFRYTAAGEIHTSAYAPNGDATQTIEILNLNANVLIRLREFEIDGLLAGLDELSNDDLLTLRDVLSRPDEVGNLVPFTSALVHVIEGLVSPK